MNDNLTLEQIAQNENIKPDRFGMAAISFIFKAFGDNIRSKEYWPWGKDVQCRWATSKGTKKDLDDAIFLLKTAFNRIIESPETELVSTKLISERTLKERLNLNITNTQSADKITDKVNETSKETTQILIDLKNYE